MDGYWKADPIEISNRLGIVYDLQKSEFEIWFMGVDYHLLYPDFQITHEKSGKHFYPLENDGHRNGYKRKRVNRSYGSMEIEVPQDRKSTFQPQVIKKSQTDL